MSDRVLGAACVVLAAAMAWAARDYVAPISYEPVGPRAFPLLLAVVLALGGGWLVVKPGEHSAGLSQAPLRALGLMAVAVVLYAMVFERLLARWALAFGPAEYFALMCLAFACITGMMGDAPMKAVLAAALGLSLSTVGLDSNSGVYRFTGGDVHLPFRVPPRVQPCLKLR